MKALVVIDVQNDFISGTLGSQEAQAMLPDLITFVRDFEGDILYTLDTHNEGYLDTLEGKHLPVLHCQKGTWGHEQPLELQTLLLEKQAQGIEKSSFGSLALVEAIALKEKTYESICCVGICTDICVISNALLLKSAYPQTPIYVKENACAGTSPKNHQNALSIMKMCHIEII